jgi:hypothetical protein
MRRALVLTNEAPRHWLRQIIPPEARSVTLPLRPPATRAESTKLFLMTYCAAFFAISGMIA